MYMVKTGSECAGTMPTVTEERLPPSPAVGGRGSSRRPAGTVKRPKIYGHWQLSKYRTVYRGARDVCSSSTGSLEPGPRGRAEFSRPRADRKFAAPL